MASYGGDGGNGGDLAFEFWQLLPSRPLQCLHSLHPLHSIHPFHWFIVERKKDISGKRASGLALQHQFRKSYDEVVVAGLQRARQPSSRNRFRSGTETTSFSGRFNADASHSSAPRMSSRSYAVD